MSSPPIAYHITFGTYGMRLHGDPRGTVHWKHNSVDEPLVGENASWRQMERALLKFPPMSFNLEQRLSLEARVPEICRESNWECHIAACQNDHYHILLSGPQEPKAIRRYLKRQLTQLFAKQWPLEERQTIWAKGGSIKWIRDRRYFDCVYDYI